MARRYSPRVQISKMPVEAVLKGLPDQETVMNFERLLEQEEIIRQSLVHHPDRVQRAFRRILKGHGYLHRADTFRHYLDLQFPLHCESPSSILCLSLLCRYWSNNLSVRIPFVK